MSTEEETKNAEQLEAERAALEAKYVGKEFVFYSPFKEHRGWFDASTGRIVRLCRQHSDEAGDSDDLWIGMSLENGQCFPLFGGEAFTRDTLEPLIPEHRFLNWNPVKDIFRRDKNAEKGRPFYEAGLQNIADRLDAAVDAGQTPEQTEDAVYDEVRKQFNGNREAYEKRVARERGAGEIIAGQTTEEWADALEEAAYGKRP